MGIITLPEYAHELGPNDSRRPVIEMFAESSDIMKVFPIETLDGPLYEGYRQSALPQLGFRAVNEASTTGAGKLTPFQESTYLMDHDIDVDVALVNRYGEKYRANQEKLGSAAAGRLWVDTFLKGDNTANPRIFDGLQRRATKFGRLTPNSVAAGGAALSLLNLDTAIAAVAGATHIIAPLQSRPLWIQAARNTALSGFVIQNWDDVGKPKMSYGGLPILWGYEKDDQPSILPFTEVGAGGGAAQCTSFYIVAFGEGKLRGIQIKPFDVKDVGVLPDQINMRTHLSWDVGIVDEHKYCLQRLSSITYAPFVA